MPDPAPPDLDADPDAGADLPPIFPVPETNQIDGRVAAPPRPSNRPVDWARWVPEVRLLEAPRIALSPVIVALALAGLFTAVGGDRLLCRALGEPLAPWPWAGSETAAGRLPAPLGGGERALLGPVRPVLDGGRDLIPGGDGIAWLGGVRVLWAVAAWGFFGLAVCRSAAVKFTRGAAGSPTDAVNLARAKWVSALGGPLLPAVGLAVLVGGLMLFGWAGDLPAVGPWLVAVLWGAALAAGAAAVLLGLIGLVGWPLMLAALAVEGTDAFDAFSRAFSYVVGRPLRLAIHIFAGLLIGAVAVSLAAALSDAAATVAADFAAVGMGDEDLAAIGTRGADSVAPTDAGPATVTAIWRELWRALPAAYAAGLFWTFVTVSYFLLRYADDAVETDEIAPFPKPEPTDDGEVPRVGVAASDRPTVERPHRPTIGD